MSYLARDDSDISTTHRTIVNYGRHVSTKCALGAVSDTASVSRTLSLRNLFFGSVSGGVYSVGVRLDLVSKGDINRLPTRPSCLGDK